MKVIEKLSATSDFKSALHIFSYSNHGHIRWQKLIEDYPDIAKDFME